MLGCGTPCVVASSCGHVGVCADCCQSGFSDAVVNCVVCWIDVDDNEDEE
jgi:hypothetical protein